MIISRTPLRISFFGGGSDYKEWVDNEQGIVLSSTIDKYIYISCRFLPTPCPTNSLTTPYPKLSACCCTA